MRFWRYIGLLIVGVVIGIALNEYGTEYMTVSEVVAPDVSMSQDTDDESVDFSERMMLERIREIQSLVEEQFYYADEVDVDVMRRAAVSAYVDGIQDPFTSYLDASENEALNDGLQGSEDFEGIGAKVISKDDAVMIEQVLK
jgi:carboxyl-terminal processing protease